jgi:AcrR family transcriptional regulator
MSTPRRKARDDGEKTRERLLETAGRVFADKGFDAATGKGICELAAANTAAVVYHFGSLDGLYAAVLFEARSRLVSTELLTSVIAGDRDPDAKIESFIGLLVKTLTGPGSRCWAARVIGREIISPSKIGGEFIDKELRGRAKLLKTLVSELTGLPPDHAVVSRGAASIIAPFLLLLVVNRRRLERAFPGFNIRRDSQDDFTSYVTQFVLGGLAAVAREARKSDAQQGPALLDPASQLTPLQSI